MDRRSFILQTLMSGTSLALPAANRMASATTPQPWASTAGPSPVSPSPATSRPRAVNVRSLGARGDGITDDTAVIQKALARFDRVFLPPGTYLVNHLLLKTGNELFGSGQQSVLLQHPAAQYVVSANPGKSGTANTRDNIANLSIHGLKFMGQAGHLAFDEHNYLLNLNAVSGVAVRACSFVGYVGDGIYLGSGNTHGLERHNEQVLIQNCLFDGVIKNNRNGISIIDGTHINIRGCVFTRSGNIDMPAGIDIEPDPVQNPFVRIQDIAIDRCRFTDMGTFSMIGLTLQPQSSLGHPAGNIRISNCYASQPGNQDQQRMFYLRQGQNVTPDATSAPLGLMISNCRSDGLPLSMTLMAVKGVQMLNCAFNHSAAPDISHSVNCTFTRVTVNGQPFQPS